MLRHSADLDEPKIAYPGCLNRTPARRSKKRGTTLTWSERLTLVIDAEKQLKIALWAAKQADSPMLAGKIRAAIKSCGGAIRHASGRDFRAYLEQRREEEHDHEVLVPIEQRSLREST